MLIYQFSVLLIYLNILIEPPDSTMTRMYKEYYDANEIRVERMWSGGWGLFKWLSRDFAKRH